MTCTSYDKGGCLTNSVMYLIFSKQWNLIYTQTSDYEIRVQDESRDEKFNILELILSEIDI